MQQINKQNPPQGKFIHHCLLCSSWATSKDRPWLKVKPHCIRSMAPVHLYQDPPPLMRNWFDHERTRRDVRLPDFLSGSWYIQLHAVHVVLGNNIMWGLVFKGFVSINLCSLPGSWHQQNTTRILTFEQMALLFTIEGIFPPPPLAAAAKPPVATKRQSSCHANNPNRNNRSRL